MSCDQKTLWVETLYSESISYQDFSLKSYWSENKTSPTSYVRQNTKSYVSYFQEFFNLKSFLSILLLII